LRHPARGRGGHGGGDRLAGHRHLRGEFHPALGLQRGDGLHGLGRRDLHRREPARRRGPYPRRSPGTHHMSAVWFVVTRLTRDRSALIGLVLIALLVLSAALAPVLATHPDDVFELHPSERLAAPSGAHWLGTDRMGADVYSRLLFGARITILIGIIALGASPWRLTVLHVLPNIASPIIVRASIGMGFTILTAAALGFLGLGPPPPTPEWGRTIAESREFLPDAWWYATAPGLAIFLTVMGFNLLGDGLRDVLDPRLRRSRTAR